MAWMWASPPEPVLTDKSITGQQQEFSQLVRDRALGGWGDSPEVSCQTGAMDGRQFMQPQSGHRFEMSRVELWFGRINQNIRLEKLSRNNRRDVRDQNLWDRTDRTRQQQHGAQLHSRSVSERKLR